MAMIDLSRTTTELPVILIIKEDSASPYLPELIFDLSH